jgi:hypothetical protein
MDQLRYTGNSITCDIIASSSREVFKDENCPRILVHSRSAFGQASGQTSLARIALPHGIFAMLRQRELSGPHAQAELIEANTASWWDYDLIT